MPLAAHIRKAYPRDEDTPGGGEEDTQTHRLLRRGIPYGASLPRGDESSSAADEDRGLLFLCYQTSIERQFEFVQARFVNDPDFPEPGAGQDPIITQDPATGSFTLPGGRQEHVALLQRFVTTTGGEYFFQPSRSALAALSAAPTAPDAPTRGPAPPRRPLAPRGSGGGRDEAPPPDHQRPGGRRGRR